MLEPIYACEMESALITHPQTHFIWCHGGISRRVNVPTVTAELERLLDTYPNLCRYIMRVVFEDYIVEAKERLTRNGWP